MKDPEKFFLLYLNITKNNFKVSITDSKGKMCFKKSEGMLKGIRKGSINSADTSLLMMNSISTDIKDRGIGNLGIYLKGATRWKKLSLRRLFKELRVSDIWIKFIRDLTEAPHNGCTFPSKKRKRKRRKLKRKLFLKENYSIKKNKNDFRSLFIEKKSNKRFKKSKKFFQYIKSLK
jgi:ribosomal protein S11